MHRSIWIVGSLFAALAAPAQSFMNAGSPPGLSGGSIPQGSIFSIFGQGIGPAALVQVSSFPLSTSLAGVSVRRWRESAAAVNSSRMRLRKNSAGFKQIRALENLAGAWKDKDHPELSAGADRWVKELRKESDGHFHKSLSH